jgi:uncharacterized protein (DUF2062 family)
MLKVKVLGFLSKYKHLYIKLKKLCFDTEPKKTALALTFGILLGIIPVLGVTLISVTLVGVIFRLKQVILQATHLLISPLQILFIPIFIKCGQLLFAPHVPIVEFTINSFHLNFYQMIDRFGHLILYGLITWLIFSVFAGIAIYRICLVIFSRRLITKPV